MNPKPIDGKESSPSERERPRHTPDALLLALVRICQMLGRPISAEALIAGLPLHNHRLTPELFVRAAVRAGLNAALTPRTLDDIRGWTLPMVLLLAQGDACILVEKDGEQFTIVEPESGGARRLTKAALGELYSGSAILINHSYSFDSRTRPVFSVRPGHWLRDVLAKSLPIYLDVGLASLLVNIFALASPLFVMNVYDRVVPNNAEETLWVMATGMLVIIVFDFVLRMLRGYFVDSAGKRTDLILSSTIFERVLGIKMEARPESVGAFANNFHEYEFLREFLTSATVTALVDLPFLLLFIGIIALLGGSLAWVPLLILPVGIVISIALQGPLKETIGQLSRLSSQKGATLIESLSSIHTIKTLGAASRFQRQWEDVTGHISKQSIRAKTISQAAVNVTAFLQQLGYVLVVLLGVYMIAENELTMGALIAVSMLTGRALAPLAQVASLLTRYHQARASMEAIDALMALPIEREHIEQFVHRPHFSGSLEFRNVTFSYPHTQVKALEEVSFRIAPGEHVAIIGRIGGGKSTIGKLALGLYQPQEGAVLLDGTDLRQIDPIDLRHAVGYVPQDIQLFYGSVKDNILMGAAHEADGMAVLRAADIAGVSQFVNHHPAGFDLSVGEGGCRLSGGQRQSVALARAMLLAPPVYVLDEPTNSMDNSSEEYIKQKLQQELAGKTLLVVTHRASLLTLVDRIIVIDHGRVVADGPRDQVLEALNKGQIRVGGQ